VRKQILIMRAIESQETKEVNYNTKDKVDGLVEKKP
jgi:hypothetical protein